MSLGRGSVAFPPGTQHRAVKSIRLGSVGPGAFNNNRHPDWWLFLGRLPAANQHGRHTCWRLQYLQGCTGILEPVQGPLQHLDAIGPDQYPNISRLGSPSSSALLRFHLSQLGEVRSRLCSLPTYSASKTLFQTVSPSFVGIDTTSLSGCLTVRSHVNLIFEYVNPTRPGLSP